LQSHKKELKLFFNKNFTNTLLISETHCTDKIYHIIPKYKLYINRHLDGTAHGATAILKKKESDAMDC